MRPLFRRSNPRRAATTLLGTAALVPVLAVAVTACGGSTSGTATSGLAAAMDSVSGTGPTANYFEYGDIARFRALGLTDLHRLSESKWRNVVGVGESNLVVYEAVLPGLTGVDPFAADTAITIGEPPHSATRLDGTFDASRIATKLRALGAKTRDFGGTPGLSFGADNQIDSKSRLAKQLHSTNPLLQNVVTSSSIATSFNAASLESALDPGTSLLDTAGYSEVASCLGDAVVAIVMTPSGDPNATLVAVGVTDPDSLSDPGQEVLCMRPAAGKAASVEAAVRRAFAPSATDPFTNSPMSDYLTRATVTQQDGLVRADLTDVPKGSVGYLVQGIERDSYRVWDGSCSARDVASRQC